MHVIHGGIRAGTMVKNSMGKKKSKQNHGKFRSTFLLRGEAYLLKKIVGDGTRKLNHVYSKKKKQTCKYYLYLRKQLLK